MQNTYIHNGEVIYNLPDTETDEDSCTAYFCGKSLHYEHKEGYEEVELEKPLGKMEIVEVVEKIKKLTTLYLLRKG